MSGAWGAVNGTHDQIRFYELWNETTPYFPDARGLSVALKNNLDDARAQHLLALRGVELKKIGIESVVAITNAVHRAGDSLRMPRPPHPGEHAPLREDSDVILFPCNTVACATCGNLALTVDKGAARKGHRMDLRAFFANGISRPAKEWALLCEKCETLKPPEGDVTKGLIVVDASMGKGVWASDEEESPSGDLCVSEAAAESLGDEQITIGAQAPEASTSTSGLRVTRQTTGVRPRLNYRQCLAARKPEPTAPPPKQAPPPKPPKPPKTAQPPKKRALSRRQWVTTWPRATASQPRRLHRLW
jgi:hypothetical protein